MFLASGSPHRRWHGLRLAAAQLAEKIGVQMSSSTEKEHDPVHRVATVYRTQCSGLQVEQSGVSAVLS
jgi:hypothetical protein